MKIDKKDIAFGFTVAGLTETGNPLVMPTVTFTSAKNIDEALKFGKIALAFDGVDVVHIGGKKSRKLYCKITQKDNTFIITE